MATATAQVPEITTMQNMDPMMSMEEGDAALDSSDKMDVSKIEVNITSFTQSTFNQPEIEAVPPPTQAREFLESAKNGNGVSMNHGGIAKIRRFRWCRCKLDCRNKVEEAMESPDEYWKWSIAAWKKLTSCDCCSACISGRPKLKELEAAAQMRCDNEFY